MAIPTSHEYDVLEQQVQEDALHANRMLTVEERPFSRVTKSLIAKDSLLKSLPKQLPSPPPDAGDTQDDDVFKRQKFREDVLLDFAALESSIVRIQLIQSSNERERERYAAEKAKILQAAQAVKDNTVELRAQLLEAQKILKLRKDYDQLAMKVLDNKSIKSRDESRMEIERLEKEIEDLQQESADYEVTWSGRREYFDRIVADGQVMIRVIRRIKDDADAEKDEAEGMEDNEDDSGTPAPGERTPMPAHGGETPLPGVTEGYLEGSTPRPANRFLDIEEQARPSSGIGSPLPSTSDVEMADPLSGPTSQDDKETPGVIGRTDSEAPEIMDES